MNFNGKYRAYVVDVNDPENRGRIKVSVPAVTMEYHTTWCEPCFPYGEFSTPNVGECVWIEFQQGDLGKPVWVGTWYSQGNAPCSKGTKAITYGGASILLTDGKVLINGVDVLNQLSILEKKIDALKG